jgi:hypothetical protein
VADHERVEEGETLRNYALLPYQPVTEPVGKLRSIEVLADSFARAGLEAEARRVCDLSRERWGLGGTGWGIKQTAGEIAWELYYYSHWDDEPLSTARVLDFIDDVLVAGELPRTDEDHWSISFDLTTEMLLGNEAVDDLHVYRPHHLHAAPITCASYALRAQVASLENLYFLFDPIEDRADIDTHLADTFHGRRAAPAELLWAELFPNNHVAIAHKPRQDGLYVGGLDLDQFRAFLERVDFDPGTRRFVDDHAEELDHLRWDVGYDFRATDSGVEIVKAGFYGSL